MIINAYKTVLVNISGVYKKKREFQITKFTLTKNKSPDSNKYLEENRSSLEQILVFPFLLILPFMLSLQGKPLTS